MHIALVTYKADPELTSSDNLLKQALVRLGAEVTAEAWDHTSINWKIFDLVILRSCWDYHERPEEFKNWIKQLHKEEVNLWNPPEIILANMHKKYILDLEEQGIQTVPTIIINQGQDADITLLEDKGWKEMVAKPAIGASAFKIFKGSIENPNLAESLTSLAISQDALVQPLMTEVEEVGEYSSMFFNNSYSHTVLKKPKSGDFRSNYEQGGSSELVEQSGSIIKVLQNIVNKIDPVPLYARVDYLISKNVPVLMELELIEPSLYLDLYPPSAEILAKAILSKQVFA